MATREISFKISADDRAGDVFAKLADKLEGVGSSAKKAGDAAGGSGGMFSGLGGALGNIATVAGGIIAAGLFERIAGGISSFVTTGLDAVGKAQELEASLSSLLTSNNMYKQSTEQVTQAVTKQVMSEDELLQKQTELNAKLATQRATYQEQEERIRQLTVQYGENGLVVIKTKAQHEELALSIQKTEREMAGLTTTETKYATVTQTSYEKVMSMQAAQKMAASQTQDLMNAISKLAVVSPFETQNVEAVAKYAVAAGMSVEQTEKFTASFLDLAASVGIGSESLEFAADQLLQVKKVGKLTEVDLRQLRRIGIDVSKIIGVEMGMSVDEFNKKAETTPEIFDQLFDSISNFSQNTFAGTSKKMAMSVKGLQSTLSDVFTIGARDFFRPLVEAATPMMNEVIGAMSSAVLGGGVADLGKQIADSLGSVLKSFQAFGASGGLMVVSGMLENAFAAAMPVIESGMATLAGALNNLWSSTVLPTLTGWASSFYDWLTNGVIPAIPEKLSALVTGISSFLAGHWPAISESIKQNSAAFWNWVGPVAAEGVAQLGKLTTAFVGWVNDPATQQQLAVMGQQLGKFIIDAVALWTSGQESSTKMGGSLVLALTSAIAGIGGALIEAGGTIVANIFAGIGNAITGGNYQPWTIQQFQQFATWVGTINWNEVGAGLMARIGEGLATMSDTIAKKFADAAGAWKKVIVETKWADVGANIIKGILKGINDNVGQVLEVIKSMAADALQSAMSTLGISSPSKEFMKIGQYVAQGMAGGISGGAGQVQAAVNKMLNIDTRKFSFNEAFMSAADDAEKFADIFKIEESKVRAILTGMKTAVRQNMGQVQKLLAAGDQAAAEKIIGSGFSGDALGVSGEVSKRIASQYAGLIIATMKGFKDMAPQAAADNFNKLAQGVGKFASEASSAGTELAQRIASLQSLLRNGAQQFNLEGQITDAAGAQAYLNGLIAEQAKAQAGLAQISSVNAGVQKMMQNKQALGLLGGARGMGMGQVLQTAMAAIGAIGQQILPGLSNGDMGALGKTTVNNNNFNLTVNSQAEQENLMADFALLQSLLPAGT